MDHPFEVGGLYENRDGVYEVVRIDDGRGAMVIRYVDTGEEVESTIRIQARIRQNMDWEKQEEKRQRAAEDARHQQGYGRDFTGLYVSDFKTNTEGTTWRSRAGLAGQVSRLLSAGTPYTFVSWAIYGWPVAFLTHLEDYAIAAFELGVRKAKFTIEVDEANAYYGLYVERNAGPMDRTWDWPRLLLALRARRELQDAIEAAEVEHGVRFLGRASVGEERFHFGDGLTRGARSLWDKENPSALTVAERLRRLEEVPANEWVEIYLLGTTPKEEAVQAGVHIAHTMATAMRALLPLYTVAIRD